ncbi:hypothetical protein E1091_08395 [Micromonospora fluostatini]|uniref:Uncharacterized protein n=1 Tax=Micromonospora fluostatini TaxID=1629071 RepID=A0ABY2DII8_9ACTN|nr:hypothetical protein E1091_08395 [Micromonospora fluostatini]
MNPDLLHALGVFLLLLAALVYLAFASWLIFCYALARLPDGARLVERAPAMLASFDVRGWGDALLPWRTIARALHRLPLPAAGTPTPDLGAGVHQPPPATSPEADRTALPTG